MSEDNNIFNPEYMLKVAKQIKETEDEFAYALISPFCERIVEKRCSKKELEKILRRGMQPSIPLEKVKQAREEMKSNLAGLETWNVEEMREYFGIKKCIAILDKLIEGEDK